nr:hypothetical protein [Thermococcus peptonophilus]
MRMNPTQKVKTKAVLSTILLAVYVGALILTAGQFIATKSGSFLGMRQLDVLKLKARYGLIMLALIAVHLTLNLDLLKNELKALGR